MSCDWDVFCVDCQESLGIDNANHRDELMRWLVLQRDVIAAIPGWLSVEYDDYRIDTQWFAKHAGHRLSPRDEYGYLDTQCRDDSICAHCGHRGHCLLEDGHEGEHALRKP